MNEHGRTQEVKEGIQMMLEKIKKAQRYSQNYRWRSCRSWQKKSDSFLMENQSAVTGGHLASNLGVVELTTGAASDVLNLPA